MHFTTSATPNYPSSIQEQSKQYNGIQYVILGKSDSFFNSTIVGAYYNSESKVSTYVGQKFGIVEVGVVTGYSSYSLLPFIRVKKGNWYIAPAYEKDNWGTVLGWETKIFQHRVCTSTLYVI